MDRSKLFEEYDYNERKNLLPEGFEPLESISIPTHVDTTRFLCIGWFKTEKELFERIKDFGVFIPYVQITPFTRLETVISFKYGFYISDIARPLLKENEIVSVIIKHTPYSEVPDFVYRQIGRDKSGGLDFVNDALQKGSLYISSFNQFKHLNGERFDKYEQRNRFSISDSGGMKLSLDLEFDFKCLVLCTSLPSYTAFEDKSEWIRINNVKCFISELVDILTKSGIEIFEVLYGNCYYGDKTIIDQNDFLPKYLNDHPEQIMGPILPNHICQKFINDIIMSKPANFIDEKEFRIVFKLSKRLDDYSLSDNIKRIGDGIVVTDKSLTKYFEPVD